MAVGVTREVGILFATSGGSSRVHPAIITPAIISARRIAMLNFIIVSVWGEDYIIVYLFTAGILKDTPLDPERL
jgi:hypothetical protein